MTDVPDRLQEWDEFSEAMRDYIETFIGKKYGDPTLNVPVPAFIAIWNILKYSIRCWRGESKHHDIFKICHYCCFAWIANEKNSQAPCYNPLINPYDPDKYCIKIGAETVDAKWIYEENQTPVKVI